MINTESSKNLVIGLIKNILAKYKENKKPQPKAGNFLSYLQNAQGTFLARNENFTRKL
jgi:hypothetical protein